MDLSKVDNQSKFKIIPDKTAVKVRLLITPGYHDDEKLELKNGWGTCNEQTGSVYLKATYEILEGEYEFRKIHGCIGLLSEKGPLWGKMGLTFLKAILQSSRNVLPDDDSPEAISKLNFKDFGEFNNLVFAAVVSVKKDDKGNDRNEIKYIITPDDSRYETIMGKVPAKAKVKVDEDFDDDIPWTK